MNIDIWDVLLVAFYIWFVYRTRDYQPITEAEFQERERKKRERKHD